MLQSATIDSSIEQEQLDTLAKNLPTDAMSSISWAGIIGFLLSLEIPLVGHVDGLFIAVWSTALALWSLTGYLISYSYGRKPLAEWSLAARRRLFRVFYLANAFIWIALIIQLFHLGEGDSWMHPDHAHDVDVALTHTTSRLLAVLVVFAISLNYVVQQSAHYRIMLSPMCLVIGSLSLAFFSQARLVPVAAAVLVLVLGAWFAVLGARLNKDITRRMVAEKRINDAATRLSDALEEADTLRKSAEAASRAKTSFLATMSHELRTPLNAIIGFSELLSAGYFPDNRAKQIEYATDIHKSGKHLLSLVEDVLDIQKIEGGRRKYEFESLDIRDCLDTVLPMLDERAREKGVTLRMDLPAITFPSVDAQSIRQIIINLTSNAIRHTPPGGCVSLSASEDAAACYLRVSDTGEGIPLKIQNSVFEAFVTCADESNASLTATESGTGLGLAITRELVVAHGGQIWFDTGDEQGTTFHIALPKVSRPDDTPIEPLVTRPETSAA